VLIRRMVVQRHVFITRRTGRSTNRAPKLKDQTLSTKALKVNFLAVDPSGQFETGDVVPWSNKLVLRNSLLETDGRRTVELFVAPRGEIRYTLDGSEPVRASLTKSQLISATMTFSSASSVTLQESRLRKIFITLPRARKPD
jgi:Chitobiase/beta-hexosaminidase C-terminal domain